VYGFPFQCFLELKISLKTIIPKESFLSELIEDRRSEILKSLPKPDPLRRLLKGLKQYPGSPSNRNSTYPELLKLL